MTESEWGTTERLELQSVLSETQSILSSDLTHPDFGVFGLGIAAADFERVRRLLNDLSAADLQRVGANKLTQITNHLGSLRDSLKRAREYDASKETNPGATRDSIASTVRSVYDAVFDLVAPLIAVARPVDQSIGTLVEEARRELAELRALREQARKEHTTASEEIEDTLALARNAVAVKGAAGHARRFGEEAEAQREFSVWWLIATAATAVLTLAYAFAAALNPGGFLALPAGSDNATTATGIQLGLAKVLIFTVMISAVIWLGRNYRAARHNFVVNKHRSNALATFDDFVTAAGGDTATKNAVLLQATLAIFSPQPTGYVTHDTDQVGSSQALEVIRSIMGQPK